MDLEVLMASIGNYSWLIILFVVCMTSYYIYTTVRTYLLLQKARQTKKELEQKGKELKAEYEVKVKELEKLMEEKKTLFRRRPE